MMVRLFAGMVLMFTLAMWAAVPTFKYLPDVAIYAMHGFYALAAVVCLYGVITGRAPS